MLDREKFLIYYIIMKYYDNGMAVCYLHLELERDTYCVSFGYEDFTNRKSQKKMHNMQDHTLQFIEFGEGFYHLDKDIFKLKQNDLFYIPANRPILYYKNKQNPYKYYWISLTGPNIEYLLSQCGISAKKPVLNFNTDNSILSLFQMLNPSIDYTDFQVKSILYAIFNKLQGKTKVYTKKNISNEHTSLVKEIIQFININIANNELTVDLIVKMFNLTPVTLYRIFSKYENVSIKQYIIKKRIETAKNLLQQDYNITFAALHCGFSDIYYFSKAFKKYTGYSPSQYIRSLKNDKTEK